MMALSLLILWLVVVVLTLLLVGSPRLLRRKPGDRRGGNGKGKNLEEDA